MSRSRGLALLVLLALSVSTAGCAEVLLGSGPLSFTATDATVGGEALDETGYVAYRNESINQTRTFSVAGQNRTVELSSELHAYNRTGSLGDLDETELGRIVVLSTPAVSIRDRTLNPLGHLSARDLAARLSGPSDAVAQFRPEGNRTVRTLGSPRTVSTFGTVSATDGASRETTVHVTSFEHGSDFVVVVAVHPDRVEDEPDRIDRLLGALRHRTTE